MKQYGFTLIELMVTLTIATIVLTVGVPSFRSVIEQNQLATQSNRLLGALTLARSEAIKRGVTVTMCVRNGSGTSCRNSPRGNWEAGWLVFTDLNEDGAFSDDGDATPCESGEECILRIFEAVPASLTLRTGNTYAKWISYLPSGRSKGSGGLANGTFRLCKGSDTSKAHEIVVSVTGRATVRNGANVCP